MVPRSSASFCLYDTRSLSENFADNDEMLQRWMTKGVRHGELVIRYGNLTMVVLALLLQGEVSNDFVLVLSGAGIQILLA